MLDVALVVMPGKGLFVEVLELLVLELLAVGVVELLAVGVLELLAVEVLELLASLLIEGRGAGVLVEVLVDSKGDRV